MKFILINYYLSEDRKFKETRINSDQIESLSVVHHTESINAEIVLVSGKTYRVKQYVENILSELQS